VTLLGRYDEEQIRDLLEDATPEQQGLIAEALEAVFYQGDPVAWVTQRLGGFLWSKQREITEAVRDHRKVAVKACHGPGKSHVAARIVGWWEDTHPVGSAFAVTTAPTDPQVKAILWREINRAHKAGNLPGRVTLDAQWKMNEELVAFGRKPADHDESGFQGIHARYVLVVLDEACGIPKTLWTATDTLVTNEDARILAIGNPDDPMSEFATICAGAPEDGSSGMSKEDWYVITISTFDTPNFTGEFVPEELRHYLPSRVWLEERRRKWGEGSPLWLSKVEGRFPPDASSGVILWSWLRACATDAKIGPLRVPVQLGIDVAGSELGDETVIWERAGGKLGRRWSVQSSDPEDVLRKCEEAILEAHPARVKVDSIGVGFGIVGGLRRSFPDLDVVAVNVAEAAPDPENYTNLRAWLWWEVGRRLFQDQVVDLSGPDPEDQSETARLRRLEIEELMNQLAIPQYKEINGRIQIESKDDIRKRLGGDSPDDADACLLAYYDPPSTFGVTSQDREEVLSGEDSFR
jgi:hypothetical protein